MLLSNLFRPPLQFFSMLQLCGKNNYHWELNPQSKSKQSIKKDKISLKHHIDTGLQVLCRCLIQNQVGPIQIIDSSLLI